MQSGLQDKAVLITGAGSGLGRACALVFAREGAKVAAADIDIAAAQQTVDSIRALNGTAVAVAVDVSRAQDVRAAVDRCVAEFGRLDCAINNAGIAGDMAPIHETDEAVWDRVIAINQTGVFLCLKYEVAQMLKQGGGGAIVNMSSVAALRPSGAGATPYTVSKHGVIGLTREVALECAKHGIRVNAICPGTAATPLVTRARDFSNEANVQAAIRIHPLGRLCEPDEVAEAAVFLCSDVASFITGYALPVDGGRSI